MPHRPDYDATSYELVTYADAHKQGYLRVRNDALDQLMSESQHPGDRLRVLEVACGPGLSLSHLTRARPDAFLVAIDQSWNMLRQSRRQITDAASTPRLTRATALRLPFATDAFDFVFATRFIHIFPDKSKVVRELRRVLRPGGTLAIEFYGRPYHLLTKLARRMPGSWRQFLWQYPTLDEVRALMGSTTRFIPLRFGGERWLRRALGDERLQSCLRRAWHTPFQPLVAEYFAVSNDPGDIDEIYPRERRSARLV